MSKRFKSFLADDAGATAMEYALLAGLIGLAVIACLTVIGGKLSASLNTVSSKFQ
jgi:pilus assembly protein Flp/PilA